MLGSKLNHVSKRGHCRHNVAWYWSFFLTHPRVIWLIPLCSAYQAIPNNMVSSYSGHSHAILTRIKHSATYILFYIFMACSLYANQSMLDCVAIRVWTQYCHSSLIHITPAVVILMNMWGSFVIFTRCLSRRSCPGRNDISLQVC